MSADRGRRGAVHGRPPAAHKGSIVMVIPDTVIRIVIRKPAFIGSSLLFVHAPSGLGGRGGFALDLL